VRSVERECRLSLRSSSVRVCGFGVSAALRSLATPGNAESSGRFTQASRRLAMGAVRDHRCLALFLRTFCSESGRRSPRRRLTTRCSGPPPLPAKINRASIRFHALHPASRACTQGSPVPPSGGAPRALISGGPLSAGSLGRTLLRRARVRKRRNLPKRLLFSTRRKRIRSGRAKGRR